MANTGKQTIKGGCHCGIINYSAEITIPESGPLSTTRCNCTFCNKLSTTYFILKDPSDFNLLSPASREELGDYQPRIKYLHRYFCKECGTHLWMEGWFPFEGGKVEIFNLNLASVDEPQEGIDLSEVKVRYFGMLNGNFKAGLANKPYPGGLL